MEYITHLQGPDRVRKRPAVIFGSDDLNGCLTAVWMLVLCSLDEVALGYADKLELQLYQDGSVSVADNGRGIYVQDINGSDAPWHLRFTQLDGCPDVQDQLVHVAPGWLCGNRIAPHKPKTPSLYDNLDIFLCCIQYSSKMMVAEICRDSKLFVIRFEEGRVSHDIQVLPCCQPSGTKIHFLPDPALFTETRILADDLAQMADTAAMFYPGLTVRVTASGRSVSYCYPDAPVFPDALRCADRYWKRR